MRLPRKLKKKAKKLKAAHDAVIMAQAAMTSAMGIAQLAVIISTPGYYPHDIGLKAVKGAQIAIDSAQAIQKCLAQIKPYQYYAKH